MNTDVTKLKKQLRELVANYMQSEGCSCCQNVEKLFADTYEVSGSGEPVKINIK